MVDHPLMPKPEKPEKPRSEFWQAHRDRLVYMAIATVFGIAFLRLGMVGEGKTILIGVATFALNKVRGTIPNGVPK